MVLLSLSRTQIYELIRLRRNQPPPSLGHRQQPIGPRNAAAPWVECPRRVRPGLPRLERYRSPAAPHAASCTGAHADLSRDTVARRDSFPDLGGLHCWREGTEVSERQAGSPCRVSSPRRSGCAGRWPGWLWCGRAARGPMMSRGGSDGRATRGRLLGDRGGWAPGDVGGSQTRHALYICFRTVSI